MHRNTLGGGREDNRARATMAIPDPVTAPDGAETRFRASLDALIRVIERSAAGMRGSILLLDDDGVTLRHGAAPSLPEAYCSLIDGERIGPSAGSCGTAVYRREQVIVRDISTDPLWSNYRQAAEPFGLAACWSTPILDEEGVVLGSFAFYYDHRQAPTDSDLALTETAASLAANIITGARAMTALRSRTTALRESQEQLESSQQRLRAALDASATSTWRWDMQTNAVESDEGLSRLFGVDPSSASGSFELFVSRIHPGDRDRVIAAAQRCAAEGVDLDEEFRIVFPDGSIRWAVDKGKTVLGDDGKPRYLIGAAVDITERRAQDQQFRALAESLPQLAWMADDTGSRFWYNQRWYDYTGATHAEALGWAWQQYHHPEHIARIADGISRAWQAAEPWEDTFPLRGKDGQYRWFLSRAVPIRDADGNAVRWFGTSTDITEVQETKLARDRALAEAERANRAKSEFLAAMSHDLRTPLNAIGGFADLTADGLYGPVNDAQRKAMGRIRRAGDHLLTLINDILTFSKIEAGRVQVNIVDVPVNEVMVSASSMLETQASRKGLSLENCPGAERVQVLADRERITQIMTNLLTNAVKFTDAGSVVLGWDADQQDVRIEVRDTGRGIPADKLAAVFEPFVQAGRSAEELKQGVGLGLAISRELALAMHGELSVESAVGHGSTFTLRLPRGADAN